MSYGGRNKSNYGHSGGHGGHGGHGSSNYYGSSGGNHGGYVKEDDNEVLQLFSQCHNSGINFDKYDNIPVQVTPNDPSLRPLQSFQDLSNIHPILMSNIQRCNYVKPTPVQKYGIPVIFTNKDLMACAQTGSGKTAAFLLVHINNLLLQRHHNDSNRNRGMAYPSILILSPTRELATQIYDESRKFIFQTPIRTSVVYGGADYKHQFRQLEANPEILVATPGRLMDMLERGKLSLSNIKTLVLDEADRMLDMGFEKDIRFILKQSDIPPTGRRQTLMFSATFPKSVQQIASEFLRNYVFLTMGRVGSTSDFITQTLLWVEESQKRFYLLGMLICGISSNFSMGSTLVFVNHKQEAQSLSMFLKNHGIPSNSIHGDRSQDERESALKAFKSGHVGVLVATDVAARGLDIPNVAYVIQYDMAGGIDDYVHRIGRTGRAGNSGHAIAFINDRSKGVCPELLEMLRESNQNIPLWLEGIVKQLGAFNSARQAGEGNFGGQDVREDKSYSNPTKTNQAFDNFNEDAYRGYQWTASDPSSHHQHQHQHHPYNRGGGRQSRGYSGGGGGSGRGGRNSATWNDP